LDDIRRLIDAKDTDIFDVLAFVRFALSPKTRHDRADAARREGLDGQEAEMKAFLDDVLAAYERKGVGELSYDKLGHFIAVRYGTTTDAKNRLGDMGTIRGAFRAVQRYLYRA
jgi:type I restriction enzyme, R subunit